MHVSPVEIGQFFNGTTVNGINDWQVRSTELLDYFQNEVYGLPPYLNFNSNLELIEEGEATEIKNCTRSQYELVFTYDQKILKVNIIVFKPSSGEIKSAFLGLNFLGNHTINKDPNIIISDKYVRSFSGIDRFLKNNRLGADARGVRSERYPLQAIIDSGYAFITAFCGEICPDHEDHFLTDGVMKFFGSKHEKPNEWGAISAWAWGLSQIVNHIPNMQGLKQDRVILFGHSRLGKTTLWAAAQDKRILGVISNQSGCLGAKLSIRKQGETFHAIKEGFPHWFAKNFNQYKEETIKVDQHCLLGLIAPRPIYIASAEDDTWSDPIGQFLSLKYTQPIYSLYNVQLSELKSHPPINEPLINWLGYHIRSGSHSLVKYDWEQFIKWADLF